MRTEDNLDLGSKPNPSTEVFQLEALNKKKMNIIKTIYNRLPGKRHQLYLLFIREYLAGIAELLHFKTFIV